MVGSSANRRLHSAIEAPGHVEADIAGIFGNGELMTVTGAELHDRSHAVFAYARKWAHQLLNGHRDLLSFPCFHHATEGRRSAIAAAQAT